MNCNKYFVILYHIYKFRFMKWYLFISMLLLSAFSVAQQKPQFSQYMINKYQENPAYGGLERSLSVFTSFRDQYSNYSGNPKTFYLGADMPFYLWNGALGFSLYNHKAGVFNNTNLKISYNYVLGTSFGFLSFGGRLGLDFLAVNGNGIITPDGNYEGTLNHNDPTLDVGRFNGIGPSWEIGTYFYGKNLEAGVVLSELPTHGFALGDGTYNRAFNGSFFGLYKYDYSDELRFIPSILVKADAAVIQTDFSILSKFRDNLTFGLSFRGYSRTSLDAIVAILGTNLGQKYNIYYSYDFGLSDIRSVHQGSHEIMLSYNLQKLIGIGLPPKIIYNPRDL